MFRDVWDFVKEMTPPLIFSVVLFLAIASCVFGGIAIVQKQTCSNMQEINPERNFAWTFWTGCRVQTNSGYYIHIDNYDFNEIQIEKELEK